MPEQKHTSIEGLRIYQSSRKLEDTVYELVKLLPQEEFYLLGNDLRRSSAAISHYISEAHKRFSYTIKLEALHLARLETDRLTGFLTKYTERGYGDTASIQESCSAIVKQAWGLIKYFKQRQNQRQATAQVAATDAMVAARR